jgi:murein L,D-transpeptidase YcbB/YkuD
LLVFAFSAVHGDTVDSLYLRLQNALELYLQIADEGGWPAVPAGPTIKPGDDGPRVAALARRLLVTGDLDSWHDDDQHYNDELRDAVLRFQARHGLETDALVGKNTLVALNVPVERRIAQLRLNLERSRDLFDPELRNLLLINVPAFEAVFIRDGEIVTRTRVIVGETDAETPLFKAQMQNVVINPTWTVPYSIASEELLPKIKRDPGFLARGGYDVFDRDGQRVDPAEVDWASLYSNNFPYTLVQRPGNINELGRIKFLLPNEYGICMHDTPSKQLFAHDSRALSHGCVRMDNPVGFTQRVLETEGWTRDDIVTQLETTDTLTIPLAEPIPVIVVYLTAMVDEEGVVHFYRDIYGRDRG